MDRHEWKHKGMQCFVADEGSRVFLAVPIIDSVNRENVAAAEILRLAEESESRRVYIEDFERQAVATGEENQRLRAERDALKLTAEEGQEIIGELSMALAVLAGERLLKCGEDVCGDDAGRPCRGHLGKGAREAVTNALAAYDAICSANRRAAETQAFDDRRIQELRRALGDAQERNALLEAANLRLMEEVNEAKQHTRYLGRTREEQEELIGEARLAGELTSILSRHCRAPETPADTLWRILRERSVMEMKLRRVRFGLEGRGLPEEGGGVKILALLDSEEPPDGLPEAITRYAERFHGLPLGQLASRGFAASAWRWLREQVKDHPPSVAPESRQSSSS